MTNINTCKDEVKLAASMLGQKIQLNTFLISMMKVLRNAEYNH
jgi:hypothetical protein